MPRRMILTDAERQSLLALPIDETTLIRHWTLDERDRHLLQTRRRDAATTRSWGWRSSSAPCAIPAA